MFVEKNEDGAIIGVYANPQPGKELEFLPSDSDEILEFFKAMEFNS